MGCMGMHQVSSERHELGIFPSGQMHLQITCKCNMLAWWHVPWFVLCLQGKRGRETRDALPSLIECFSVLYIESSHLNYSTVGTPRVPPKKKANLLKKKKKKKKKK